MQQEREKKRQAVVFVSSFHPRGGVFCCSWRDGAVCFFFEAGRGGVFFFRGGTGRLFFVSEAGRGGFVFFSTGRDGAVFFFFSRAGTGRLFLAVVGVNDSTTVSSAWELTSVSMHYSQGNGVHTPLSRLVLYPRSVCVTISV